MILAIRTDKPEAELYLLTSAGQSQKVLKWQADRQLANTLLDKIDDIITSAKLTWKDLSGLIIFSGSGSFTGLRIGTATANAIAYANKIPIAKAGGDNWLELGIKSLPIAKIGEFITPDYDGLPNITRPKR